MTTQYTVVMGEDVKQLIARALAEFVQHHGRPSNTPAREWMLAVTTAGFFATLQPDVAKDTE
jgi:hypothetical protein